MGRPRGFDRERVLDHVVDLFWRHGYDGTSVEAIRHATGIGPSSLYAAFGDKRALFFEAVDRYRARVVDKALDGLEQDRGDGLAAIRAFFTRVVDGIIAGERRWGCLMTNCAVERAPWDEAAAEAARAHLLRVRAAFAGALARGATGADETQITAVASMLTAVLQGLNVMARAGFGRAPIQAAVDAAIASAEGAAMLPVARRMPAAIAS